MAMQNKRLLFGLLALALAFVMILAVKIGARWKCTEMDCWIGLLGNGLLLNLVFLFIHFSAKTLYFHRPNIATGISRIAAALIAFPLTLVAGLLLLTAVNAMLVTGIETFQYLIDIAVILLVVAVPAVLLWWHAARALRAGPNKSLDASGGSASRNLLGAATGALNRAAASTPPLGHISS